MKKLLVTIALASIALGSYAGGYFSFTDFPRGVWDDFTTHTLTSRLDTNIDVSFLFGSGTAAISSFSASTSTNNGGFPFLYNISAYWDAILHDSNYTLATNSSTSTLAMANTAANGAFSYDSANIFGVSGTTAGGTYNVYVIGWDAAYANPYAAAAAGSAVGWSSVFTYVSGPTAFSTPSTMVQSGLTPFGVQTIPDPEPATMALAGLGGVLLFGLHRKK